MWIIFLLAFASTFCLFWYSDEIKYFFLRLENKILKWKLKRNRQKNKSQIKEIIRLTMENTHLFTKRIKETKKELDYFKQELEEGKIPYVLRLKTIKLILKLESEIRKDKEKMENNKKLIDDFEKAKTMKDPELLSILKKHSENLK